MLWFCEPNVLFFCWLLDSKFMMHNNHVCFSCYGNGWILQAGALQLVKPYMVAVQSNNVAAVNEALNEIDLFLEISIQHPVLGNYFTATLEANRVCSSWAYNPALFFWLMPHKVALWIYWQVLYVI